MSLPAPAASVSRAAAAAQASSWHAEYRRLVSICASVASQDAAADAAASWRRAAEDAPA